MQISNLKIKSFRTITSEQTINFEKDLTIVGPNNSGKTNLLHSIMCFFTGYNENYPYNTEQDLPYNEKGVKTSLTCTFTDDPNGKNAEIFEKLVKLRQMLGLEHESENTFSINVYFNANNPVYQIHPGVKRPKDKQAQFSALQKQFITSVLDLFQIYYVPSNKSITELYDSFVTPFIRKKVAEVLKNYDSEIRDSIRSLSDSMNYSLSKNGISFTTSFEYPEKAIDNLVSKLDLYINDKNNSSIFSKGMGIQATTILATFKWITEQQPEKKIIWLIEEPETYMHPKLAIQSAKILEDLSENSTVIKTTHSLTFIPTTIEKIQGTSLGQNKNTIVNSYNSHAEATKDIRNSLGVKFCDYFGLSPLNLFVEGKTDREYLDKVIATLNDSEKAQAPTLASRSIQIRDFTGVSDLKGFLRSNYEIIRSETIVISLFDGDEAGSKAIRDLQGFFGKKGGFNSNKDYVELPNKLPIEGLLPESWITEAHKENSNYFEFYSEDSNEKLTDFKIQDKQKTIFMEKMFRKIEMQTSSEWKERFMAVFLTIEKAIAINRARRAHL